MTTKETIEEYKTMMTNHRISPKETIGLFEKAETAKGDVKKQIHQKIVNGNLALAFKIASETCHTYSDSFLDVLQEANYGLLKAVKGFDVSLGHQFSTYAYIYVKKYCYQFVNSDHLVRIPQQAYRKLSALETAEQMNITNDEILSHALELSKQQIDHLRTVSSINSSLVSFTKDNNDDEEIIYIETRTPEAIYFEKDMKETLRKATSCLSDEEREDLMQVYGYREVGTKIAEKRDIPVREFYSRNRKNLKKVNRQLKGKSVEDYI